MRACEHKRAEGTGLTHQATTKGAVRVGRVFVGPVRRTSWRITFIPNTVVKNSIVLARSLVRVTQCALRGKSDAADAATTIVASRHAIIFMLECQGA